MQEKTNTFDDDNKVSSAETFKPEGDKETSAEPSAVKNDDTIIGPMPADNDTMPAGELDEPSFDESESSSEIRTLKDIFNSTLQSESDIPATPDSSIVAQSETVSAYNVGKVASTGSEAVTSTGSEAVTSTGSEAVTSTGSKAVTSMGSKDDNEKPDGNCNKVNSDSVTPDNNNNNPSLPDLVIYRIGISEKLLNNWYPEN